MDKEEYRIRLESIRTLAGQQDFSAAVQVADTIDWKRVKSVRTLCMIEEIYEAAERYEDAKRVLQYAYWRAHTSKTVLYRLTEINIKTGDFSEALKYCDEFELLSPNDEAKYVLRYKLITARRDPIEARIRLLEAYRETKFTEKWAYELACLYRESGQDEKCAQLCSDMIVWFPDGKYQDRARALRDTVKGQEREPAAEPEPVTQDTTEIRPEAPRRRPERPIEEDAFRRTEDSAVKTQLADSWRTLVSGIRTEEIQLEVPETVLVFPEEDERGSSFGRTDTKKIKELEPETIGRTTIAPPKADELSSDGVQITIDDYMNGSAPSGKENELDDLLSETSAHLASAVASGRYDRIKTQEVKLEKSDVPYGQMSFDDFMPELEDEIEEPSAGAGAADEMDPIRKLYGKETDETLGLTKSYSIEKDVVDEYVKQEKRRSSDEEERRRRKAVEETLRSAGVIADEEPAPETEDAWEMEEESPEAATPAEEIADAAAAAESARIEEMLREAEEEDEMPIRAPKKKARADFGGWLGRILRSDDRREDEERLDEEADRSDREEEEESAAAAVSEDEEITFDLTEDIAARLPEETVEELVFDLPEEAGEETASVPAEETEEELVFDIPEEVGGETGAAIAEEIESDAAAVIPEETAELAAITEDASAESAAVEEPAEAIEEEAAAAEAIAEETAAAEAVMADESEEPDEEPAAAARLRARREESAKSSRKGRLFAFLSALRREEEPEDESAEDDVPEAASEPADKAGAEETAGADDLRWIDEYKNAETPADAEGAESEEAAEKAAVEEAVAEDAAAQAPEESAPETAGEIPDGTAAAAEEPEQAPEEDSTQDLIEEITSRPETIKRLPVEPRPFDDTEREIFSYFTKVPGMTEQITMALADVHNNAGDKTSRSGNIMVIGRQGAGKTHLTDAIMTAVCRDLGIRATRCAKIIASEFNTKNPAEIVSKMMGGFLVIEGAGELSDEAVEKLLRAMEFRTDHLVVMLEDEKADLKNLLLRHPQIEDKFTSTIVIPVFTNDELVAFAKAYAREKGYRMDEMGILALYTMIGDNQSATEPVTVGRVKEMMDAAIEKADSGARRIGRRLSKRAVDKDGRVLLREKDFDI